MLSMNEKKAIKLRVLSMVADKLIVAEYNLKDEMARKWFSISNTDDIDESREYAVSFLMDVTERLMDELADV